MQSTSSLSSKLPSYFVKYKKKSKDNHKKCQRLLHRVNSLLVQIDDGNSNYSNSNAR